MTLKKLKTIEAKFKAMEHRVNTLERDKRRLETAGHTIQERIIAFAKKAGRLFKSKQLIQKRLHELANDESLIVKLKRGYFKALLTIYNVLIGLCKKISYKMLSK